MSLGRTHRLGRNQVPPKLSRPGGQEGELDCPAGTGHIHTQPPTLGIRPQCQEVMGYPGGAHHSPCPPAVSAAGWWAQAGIATTCGHQVRRPLWKEA